MQTLQDIDIPKEYYKKRKKICLYKAFQLQNGDEMQVCTDIDVLALNHLAAIQFMINNMKVDEVPDLKGSVINFAIFEFLTTELTTKNLIDEGDVYCQDNNLSVTLKDKKYTIKVEDRVIKDIDIDIQPKNEIKTLNSITLLDLTNNTEETINKKEK